MSYTQRFKACKKCGVAKPDTQYYMRKEGVFDSTCKACRCAAVSARKAIRPKVFRPKIKCESDLTKEIADYFLSYDGETGLFTRKVNAASGKAGDEPGYIADSGYRMISVGGREFRAHRLAWLMTYGEFPQDGMVIDHINRIPSDNRICNLRSVHQKINAHNICKPKRQNSCGFLGVRKFNNRFTARIYDLSGKEMQIGTFDTPEEASAAYWNVKNSLYPDAVIA